jgi:nitrous oxide reductase accessory protein NosL
LDYYQRLDAQLDAAFQRGEPIVVVGDFNTGNLIDAEKAAWVIGGGKPGVMTKNAKWAFAEKADAEKYIAANGGALSTFDQAMKASYEDMYTDTKMIREKRKMMKMHNHANQ